MNVHRCFLELWVAVTPTGYRGLEHHDSFPAVLVELSETAAHLVRVDNGSVERLAETFEKLLQQLCS